jgi:TRAP-type C4-dicarboxylate transport system permease small subunit
MFKQMRNAIFKIDNWVGLMGSFCIVVNMLFVVVNVVLRVIFRTPIGGFTDIAAMISCVIVALTIAYTETENGHINVDFIAAYFPKTIQKILYAIMGLLNLTVVGTLTVCFWNYAHKASIAKTVTMTAKLPYAPFLMICTFGMLLFALTIIVKTLDRLINWEGGK